MRIGSAAPGYHDPKVWSVTRKPGFLSGRLTAALLHLHIQFQIHVVPSIPKHSDL